MIVNGTSHEIKIYALEDCTAVQEGRKLVLNKGSIPLHTVAPGTNLNAVKSNLKAPALDPGFPLKGAVIFVSHDQIPEGKIIVVSNMFRSAVKELGGDTSRLATVDGAVYEDAECARPCGCTGLAVG
jgi:hypothetical protein